MIHTLLARKLLWYAVYAAAVTALPALTSLPVPRPTLPKLERAPHVVAATDCSATCACDAVTCDCLACNGDACARTHHVADTGDRRPWWRRGPVRRAVAGIACFVSRPWRA